VEPRAVAGERAARLTAAPISARAPSVTTISSAAACAATSDASSIAAPSASANRQIAGARRDDRESV